MGTQEIVVLKGWAFVSLESKENDFIITLSDKGGSDQKIVLKGLIGFKFLGPSRKSIIGCQVLDRGSFREINIFRGKGELALTANFMETDAKLGTK